MARKRLTVEETIEFREGGLPKVGELWVIEPYGLHKVLSVPETPDEHGALIVRCESVATKRELGLSLSHWMLKHPSFPNGCPARRYQ
jgi:hypothetical protein